MASKNNGIHLTTQQIQEAAACLGFEVNQNNLNKFKHKLTSLTLLMGETFDWLDADEIHLHGRDSGHFPAKEENKLNQWVWKCDIEEAKANGILTGKRIAIKDSISVAGIPMDCGNAGLAGFLPSEDALVVARVLSHGGKIVGKTACENLCYSALSHTSVHGLVSNPHDSSRTSGGSSSGNPVALFLKEADMAIGSDSGCSVRVPASFCGCVGLKPTFGLVPTLGLIPCLPSIDHVGPMASNVEDCALLLNAIAGPDKFSFPAAGSLETSRVSFLDSVHLGVSGFKAAIITEGFWENSPIQSDIAETVKKTIARLESFGMTFKSIALPQLVEARPITSVLSIVEFAHVLKNKTQPYTGRNGTSMGVKAAFDDIYKNVPMDAQAAAVCAKLFEEDIEATFVLDKCLHKMRKIASEVDKLFLQFDVLILPTVPFEAPKNPLVAHNDNPAVEEMKETPARMNVNTCLFNLTGHPAISVNCGFVRSSDTQCQLPVGVQIVGGFNQEAKLFRVAQVVENMCRNL